MQTKIRVAPVSKRRMSLEEAKYIDRSCGKKKSYMNKKIAIRIAKRTANETGEDIIWYRCKQGHRHWHIGHNKVNKKDKS